MTNGTAVAGNGATARTSPASIKRIIMVLTTTSIWGALLFVSAGRLDWTRGWICFGISLLSIGASAVAVLWKNPELVAARGRLHRKEMRTFDKIFMAFYLPAWFALPVVAGLDAVRFGWSSLPWAALWPGVILQWLAIPPVAWAMATNPHLETTVRIQHDRGHKVITSGPYAMVRHPMYVGAILNVVGTPLVLGSPWAYAPAGFALGLFVLRTALEDRTLRRELAGYEEYAQRTRYRLLPGVW